MQARSTGRSLECSSQGLVALLTGVFLCVALVAMFTSSRPIRELEWMGMDLGPLTGDMASRYGIAPDSGGIVVHEANGIAAQAGIREGDLILNMNGTPVGDMNDFASLLKKRKTGESVTFDLVRQGVFQSVLIPGFATMGPTVPGTPPSAPFNAASTMGVMNPKWLGVEAETLAAGEALELGIQGSIQGVLIDGVTANSRGARAGLQPNDVVVAVNNQKIANTAELWALLGKLSLSTPLRFDLYRDGQFTTVSLGETAGTPVGGFGPGGFGGRCLACPGCGMTVTSPSGAVSPGLRCPGCGVQMAALANTPGTPVGGVFPGGGGRGRCLACPGCGMTVTPPAGAGSLGLRCPGCGVQMLQGNQ